MKVAAYQAPLLPCGSMQAIELIRKRVDWCESEGVHICARRPYLRSGGLQLPVPPISRLTWKWSARRCAHATRE